MPISHMIDIKDRYWKGKVLRLDGYRFINCRFDSCGLVHSDPQMYQMVRCHFRGATNWEDLKGRPIAPYSEADLRSLGEENP